MTPFMKAYREALGQAADLVSVPVEPDPELEPLSAEEANMRIREIEDKHFLIYTPTNNQRRVLTTAQTYGGHSSL